jgi:hypothetical protein
MVSQKSKIGAGNALSEHNEEHCGLDRTPHIAWTMKSITRTRQIDMKI